MRAEGRRSRMQYAILDVELSQLTVLGCLSAASLSLATFATGFLSSCWAAEGLMPMIERWFWAFFAFIFAGAALHFWYEKNSLLTKIKRESKVVELDSQHVSSSEYLYSRGEGGQ